MRQRASFRCKIFLIPLICKKVPHIRCTKLLSVFNSRAASRKIQPVQKLGLDVVVHRDQPMHELISCMPSNSNSLHQAGHCCHHSPSERLQRLLSVMRLYSSKIQCQLDQYRKTRSHSICPQHGFARVSRKLSIFGECSIPTLLLFLRFFRAVCPCRPFLKQFLCG